MTGEGKIEYGWLIGRYNSGSGCQTGHDMRINQDVVGGKGRETKGGRREGRRGPRIRCDALRCSGAV